MGGGDVEGLIEKEDEPRVPLDKKTPPSGRSPRLRCVREALSLADSLNARAEALGTAGLGGVGGAIASVVVARLRHWLGQPVEPLLDKLVGSTRIVQSDRALIWSW